MAKPLTPWTADPATIYFSDRFNVDPKVLDDWGAFDISVVTDPPHNPSDSARPKEVIRAHEGARASPRTALKLIQLAGTTKRAGFCIKQDPALFHSAVVQTVLPTAISVGLTGFEPATP
ncbi:MAG: hypothetical protein ACQEW8_04075 [Actinomycetota bacterium]